MNQNDITNKGLGQSALITGGSRGIGLGIAKELAKAGFNLAINGVRNVESVQSVLDELTAFGVKVIYAQGDISKKMYREKILQTVINEFGSLNVLINNAGIAPKERKDILEASEKSLSYFSVTAEVMSVFMIPG